MVELEKLTSATRVRGLTPDSTATVQSTKWYGTNSVEVIYEDATGNLGKRLLSRDDEPGLELVEAGRRWAFDGDGEMLRLVSEAYRIHRAWLFDPYLAISTSVIEPLPHQITAVYESMLPRQPMRYLLADDPGAGKTIMAGLLIKELVVRGDLERCLIVSPGSLTEQWQDELYEKFGLKFEILTTDMIEASRTANPFEHSNLILARLDQLSRNEDLQERFKVAPEWDLIVCDEAHRMSGHFMGGEVKLTKRYKLGQVLGEHCRNLLLMTATPHNGKEEDFQLFMALLDGDRFEGRFRDGVHLADSADLMRRYVKEDLRYFDGKPLFPERRSYTVQYVLSTLEAQLYTDVTEYVRNEMNRADQLSAQEGARRNNVGFALQTLQRRLASSPEAICRSIERRRERLESRLAEERTKMRGGASVPLKDLAPKLSDEDWEELAEEAPQEEVEEVEATLIDNATAARTVEELGVEIQSLKDLEALAQRVVESKTDTKWSQLKSILDDPLMKTPEGARRKLVIFTEFRDTLQAIARRVRTYIGRADGVVEVHGGVTREDRRKAVHSFMNDPEVVVLVANDAAGEGVNLQRAHLMVNYDLPWNPNRLEQRFGRIHRIGQKEVCHLWNLLAKDTREGDVYTQLLHKLEAEREALGGKVFDVLGSLFDQKPLRELLIEAIRYGNDPEVKARLHQAVDDAAGRAHLQEVLERRALVHDQMDLSRVQRIREDMERAHARRLQPHFIQTFFIKAFEHLGGHIAPREHGRWEIAHVPQAVRDRDRVTGHGAPVLKRYERICFEKDRVGDTPRAELVCPGHPLLDSTIDLLTEKYRDLLKAGAILIDENDPGTEARLLFYLEHTMLDGRRVRGGKLQAVSMRFQFVEVDRDGVFKNAGSAPYLDYRPARVDEGQALGAATDDPWVHQDWEHQVLAFAIKELVPEHRREVCDLRLPRIDKTEEQVKARLQKEINYWDHRAEELRAKEKAGKETKLPAHVAQERADRLMERMKARLDELKLERAITAEPPRLIGGALVVPAGLLRKLCGEAAPKDEGTGPAREVIEKLAMDAVIAAERALGREPRDVSREKCGYDIESRDPTTGSLAFVEVKGRYVAGDDITVTRNEILRALNEPEKFRLVVVVVDDRGARPPVYVRKFDWGQPGFEQVSATYKIAALLSAGGPPC